jgi:hypothetical protein
VSLGRPVLETDVTSEVFRLQEIYFGTLPNRTKPIPPSFLFLANTRAFDKVPIECQFPSCSTPSIDLLAHGLPPTFRW